MNIILISSNITNSGGTERIGIGLANELAQYPATTVTIISLFGCGVPFFDVNDNVRIVTLFKRYISLSVLFPLVIIRLRKFLRQSNNESIILNIGAMLSFFSITANIGLTHKNIIWEHFNVSLAFGNKKERLARSLACKYADAIVTLTAKDKEMYSENFEGKAEVSCIPNFLTFPIEYQPMIEKQAVALTVGRLTEQKGFDRLLKIWSMLPDTCNHWQLKIVGDGEDQGKLNTLIEEYHLTNVHLISATQNIQQYYEEASIYLMTSRWEGLPMVLIEAQSYGLPIVSYDCLTGPKDIVTNGKNGFLIPNGEEEEFVKSLILILENQELRANLSVNARTDSSRFNKTKIIGRWVNLFKNLK